MFLMKLSVYLNDLRLNALFYDEKHMLLNITINPLCIRMCVKMVVLVTD